MTVTPALQLTATGVVPVDVPRRRLRADDVEVQVDFCGVCHTADVEVVGVDGIGAALERLERGDVRYRFVLDTAGLAD